MHLQDFIANFRKFDFLLTCVKIFLFQININLGDNIKRIITRFANSTQKIQEVLKKEGYDFMHSEHLGWILTCPSNLGTGLRAGCMVKCIWLFLVNFWKSLPTLIVNKIFSGESSSLFGPQRLQRGLRPNGSPDSRNRRCRLCLYRRNLGYFQCWPTWKIWGPARQHFHRRYTYFKFSGE